MLTRCLTKVDTYDILFCRIHSKGDATLSTAWRSIGALTAALGEMYRRLGYRKFKMSKFEEYDLYAEYKSFLKSDSIITFTGANGRLLALKPDVTLSIVKNTRGGEVPEKVYYNESVYRMSPATHEFQELTQVGLECVGEIDLYAMGEVLSLAAQSLAAIAEHWMLDISHMGFAAALLREAGLSARQEAELLECVGRKSPHDVRLRCREWEVPEDAAERLAALAELSGPFAETLAAARALDGSEEPAEALDELGRLYEILLLSVPAEKLRLDFSIVNDMRYYNGVTFQGYIEGLPASVLSGGRYDHLLKRLGKRAGAIGFAVYLDQLERLEKRPDEYDVDALILYDDYADALALANAVRMLTSSGQRVLARRGTAEGIRCRQVLRLRERGLEIVE